jgi:hypothetical protein
LIVTPPPAPQPLPLETLLARSWALFRRNWIVALPPVIALVVIAAVGAAVFGAIVVAAFAHRVDRLTPALGGGFALGFLAFFVVAIAAGIWAQAAMFGMADAAWAKGTATFADGFAAFRRCGLALIVAGIGIIGLAIVAFVLALPTLGLAFLALPLFTMYVVPSVVTGGRDGFTAVGESFRLVQRFFGTSAIVLLVLLGIQYGISMLASAPLFPLQMAAAASLGNHKDAVVPALGYLAAAGVWFVLVMIVVQGYTAYYTIALVGLYRSLFGQPGPAQPPGPSAPAIVV